MIKMLIPFANSLLKGQSPEEINRLINMVADLMGAILSDDVARAEAVLDMMDAPQAVRELIFEALWVPNSTPDKNESTHQE